MLSKVIAMLDVAMIAIGVGFFVAAVLYVLACERM
jgi:predicted membrane-bound dolichyl-phosphate-mannose-protein mannosyltransferase